VIDLRALVLVGLLAAWLLETLASCLQRAALARPVPPELASSYDDARLERARRYGRARNSLGQLSRAWQLALLLGFWALGGFGWLEASLAERVQSELARGLLFVGALALAGRALSLPFTLWSTFGVEARFGFNRTTARTFLSDQAKGLLLMALLGGPLLALILWVVQRFGPDAWPWAWLGLTLWTLALQLVAPRWILPLYLRFEPLPAGDLRERLTACAARAGFPLADVSVVDGSRRSAHANAFFIGFGRTRRVALYDTLVERHPVEELEGVLAHEIGHYKLGHVPRGIALSLATSAVWLWAFALASESTSLHECFGLAQPSAHTALVLLALVAAPIQLVLGVAESWISRRHEYQADAFAARTTGAPQALADALLRLASTSLAPPAPHGLHTALHASHPPLAERVRALSG